MAPGSARDPQSVMLAAKLPTIQEEDCREVTGGHSPDLTRAKDGAYTHQREQKTSKYKKRVNLSPKSCTSSGVTYKPRLKIALFPPKEHKSKTWKDQTVSEDLSLWYRAKLKSIYRNRIVSVVQGKNHNAWLSTKIAQHAKQENTPHNEEKKQATQN